MSGPARCPLRRRYATATCATVPRRMQADARPTRHRGSLVATAVGCMPLAKRLTIVVVQTHPYAMCFTCLAMAEAVTEAEVRAAAQIAVIRDGLRVIRRACYRCARVDEVLVRKDGDQA